MNDYLQAAAIFFWVVAIGAIFNIWLSILLIRWKNMSFTNGLFNLAIAAVLPFLIAWIVDSSLTTHSEVGRSPFLMSIFYLVSMIGWAVHLIRKKNRDRY